MTRRRPAAGDQAAAAPTHGCAPSCSCRRLDGARLAKQTYLTLPEAAFYLGYTHESYRNPRKAFHGQVGRHALPRCYRGRRLLFRRDDLDAFVAGPSTPRRKGTP